MHQKLLYSSDVQASSFPASGGIKPAFFEILEFGQVQVVPNLLQTCGRPGQNLNFFEFLLVMCEPQVFQLWSGSILAKLALDGSAGSLRLGLNPSLLYSSAMRKYKCPSLIVVQLCLSQK